jgi:hypothetical protein
LNRNHRIVIFHILNTTLIRILQFWHCCFLSFNFAVALIVPSTIHNKIVKPLHQVHQQSPSQYQQY